MNDQLPPGSRARLNETVRQAASFAVIGVASTLAYVAIYALLRQETPAVEANALALTVTAIGNTAANRRWTFGIRGHEGLARDHAAGLLALGVALAITTASVAALSLFVPHRGRLMEIAVLVAANASATLVRFLLLRLAISRRGGSFAPARLAATLSNLERIQG